MAHVFDQMFLNESNVYCFECGVRNVQWTSVNNAIFLCMNCSGVHRGFGVNLSFVRSTTMDEWSPKQLTLMMLGGNDKLKDFLADYDIPHEPYINKYKTKACVYYRQMLEDLAESKDAHEKPDLETGRE